jgi:hypothetical protein
MHPFTLERPRDLAAALALRAQAGLTIIGQKAVNRPVRPVDNRNPAQLRSIAEFWRGSGEPA